MNSYILALGSNIDREANISNAQLILKKELKGINFSRIIQSKAVGNGIGIYANCLAQGKTMLTENELKIITKSTETICGNSKERREKGEVVIDIDIIAFNGEKRHKKDWERDYIQKLYKEI